MKKITRRVYLNDGTIIRQKSDMYGLLNYNIQRLLNKAHRVGDYGFPELLCSTNEYPDYLALYNQPVEYHKTDKTGVCFYLYDKEFDQIDGIYNAIYFDNNKLLRRYIERFKNVSFFISPDYSVFGDIPLIENLIRIWKARIVSLWFSLELHAVTIPNAMYWSEESFPIGFQSLEQCEVIAFSTKGHVRYSKERRLTEAAVRYAVDHLPLKTIIVYSICGDDANSLKLFQYAIDHGIKIVIPENSLRKQNVERRMGNERK